ncbi:MAG: recombinase family protein [Syntrophobacteraceae bacterium]
MNDLAGFGRSAKDLLVNTEILATAGVIFHAKKDKIDLSASHGNFLFTILCACAELETSRVCMRAYRHRIPGFVGSRLIGT